MTSSDWLRADRLPHIFCAGCGNGTVLNCTLNAVDQMGWKEEETVFVSGIGCSSRAPGYILADSLHTTHGRALAFATGIKMAKPELNVVVLTGDGDLAAIGGNHFIHACRRNIDFTVICMNNMIYGMTGGRGARLRQGWLSPRRRRTGLQSQRSTSVSLQLQPVPITSPGGLRTTSRN